MSITSGLHSHQFFLQYAKLIISYLDCRGIACCSLIKTNDSFLMRKALFLSMFNIRIFHIPGQINQAADFLSRHHRDQRAADKSSLKGLTAPQAIRIIEAVHFKPITLSPEEVKAALACGEGQPGPDGKKKSTRVAPAGRELPHSAMGLIQKPGRKVKTPQMERYSKMLPRLRAQLEDSGELGRQRARESKEREDQRSEEEQEAWIQAEHKLDPMTLACQEDKAYLKWLDKPRGPPPEPSQSPQFQEFQTKLATIREEGLANPPDVSEENPVRSSSPLIPNNPIYDTEVYYKDEFPQLSLDELRSISSRVAMTRARTRADPAPAATPARPRSVPPPSGVRPRRGRPPRATSVPARDISSAGPTTAPPALASPTPELPPSERDTELLEDIVSDFEQDKEGCCEDNEAGLDCEHGLTNNTWSVLATQPLRSVLTLAQFAECQKRDGYCKGIRDLLESTEDSSKKRTACKKFSIEEDVLLHTDKTGTVRKVIPLALLRHKVNVSHFSHIGIHQNYYKIANTVVTSFFRPNLLRTIRSIVEDCAICPFVNRVSHKNEQHGVVDYPRRPRTFYSIDWVSGLPKTEEGYNSVLLVVDRFSLLTRYYAVKNRGVAETIRVLNLVAQADANPIQNLKSDQESCLKTEEFKTFCAENGINHRFTAAGRPQSNATSETMVKPLKRSVRLLTRVMGANWSSHLHLITIAQAKQVCITSTSPERAHFGFESLSPYSLLDLDLSLPLETLVEKEHEKVIETRKKLLEKRNKAQEVKRDPRPYFLPGQIVMYAENPIKSHSSIKLRNSGPYKILDNQENDSFAVWCENIKTSVKRKLPMKDLQHYTAIFPQGDKDAPVE